MQDSLVVIRDSTAVFGETPASVVIADVAMPMTDVAAVYGENTARVVQEVTGGVARDVAGLPFTVESAAFQVLSLAVLGYYCWMIYQFRGQAAVCMKSVASLKTDENAGTRSLAEAGNKQLYERFIAAALLLGALCFGIAAAKAMAMAVGEPTAVAAATADYGGELQSILGTWMSTEWMPAIAVAGAGIVAVAMVLLQTAVMKVAGSLTLNTKTTDETILVKKNCLAAAAVLIAPGVLVYTGINPLRDQIIVYIITGVAVMAAVMLALKTMRLFMVQKVSLLVWFLYLCALEIFPIALTALLVAKNV